MNKLWNDNFYNAAKLLHILEEHGHEAFFVGGCVRDFLLHRPISDIDIASSALPEEVMDIFEKVIPIGLAHGTVMVRFNHVSYEITTFRHHPPDSHSSIEDGTYPVSIENDLHLRDFTINALAMDRHGKLVDLFNGQQDLKDKTLRGVGNARDRFLEDPLRMLRGIRFVSQLGFSLEPQTCNEITILKEKLETVAVERITGELTALFQGTFINDAMVYMKKIQLYRHIPVWKTYPTIVHKIPKYLTSFHSIAEVIALLHYLDESITIGKWVKEWKCSNHTKQIALRLYKALFLYDEQGLTHWVVYHLKQEDYSAYLHLVKILKQTSIEHEFYNITATLPIMNRAELNVNGDDIQQVFSDIPKGKWIEDCLKEVEYRVVMGLLTNNNQIIKEWITCHPPEIN